ncbi:MAG: hypothetical protein LBS85_01665, partial [Clostridiales Family XIII bacterium]|nr:hypothetical protein [Clostridiales Family XIII bacterium]
MFSDTALTAFKFAMNDMLLPLACAFAVTAIVAHILIPFLKKIGSTQNIHEEVKAHQGKSGTPTMGG